MTTTARRRSRVPEPDAARIYDSLRTAHLERFEGMVPAWVLYQGTRYDFDDSSVPDSVRLLRVSRPGALLALVRTRFRAVEVNEPLMTGRWLDLLAEVTLLRLLGLVTGRRTRVSAYCISLTDPATKLHARRRLPIPLARVWSRLVLRLLLAGIDRLAIGTQASWDLLESYVGPRVLRERARLFPALPSACDCVRGGVRDAGVVLFVGAFSDRKGIRELMRAWERLDQRSHGLTLHLIGVGGRVDEVISWAADRPEVHVAVNPPREQIHAALRSAHVVVLPSQRVGYWREQVGLPIVEALAHGCEVVTTDETGLATWLDEHGHTVVRAASGTAGIAAGIAAAAGRDRSADVILADLPEQDSRVAADRWMLGEAW